LQDALRLKDNEIERLQKEQADLATLYASRPSMSLCSPHGLKPSLDVFSTQAGSGSGSMNLNIELQAKMIEELLVKNAQLSDENT